MSPARPPEPASKPSADTLLKKLAAHEERPHPLSLAAKLQKRDWPAIDFG